MFGEWSFTYIAASYRLVGHCIDLQTSTLISSFGCSSVGSHLVSVALTAVHHHFVGFPPAMPSVGRPAQPTQAHLLIFCFALTMLPVGYPESPSLGGSWALGGSILWDLAVVSPMTAVHFGTLKGTLPFCFDVRL